MQNDDLSKFNCIALEPRFPSTTPVNKTIHSYRGKLLLQKMEIEKTKCSAEDRESVKTIEYKQGVLNLIPTPFLIPKLAKPNENIKHLSSNESLLKDRLYLSFFSADDCMSPNTTSCNGIKDTLSIELVGNAGESLVARRSIHNPFKCTIFKGITIG